MGNKPAGDSGLPFGLGDVFKGIGNLLELVARMHEEGKSEVSHSGSLPGLGGPKGLKGVYGFSVRVGAGGKPHVESFGNLHRHPARPLLDDCREPIVDVFDEGADIVVVAELPGVDESDIRLALEGERLRISAANQDRRYEKEVALPARADGAIRSTFKNGLLHVMLTKSAR